MFGLEFRVVIPNNEVRYGHENTGGWSGRLHAQWSLYPKVQGGEGHAVGCGRGIVVVVGTTRWTNISLDSNGKGSYNEGTRECGSWELDDIPFAERTAFYEQAAQ